MSELINNREKRKETLKNVIRQLHDGKSVDEVKKEFEEVFEGVEASEISEAETALMEEGIPIEEIQSLCDVHASVFKGSIEENQAMKEPEKTPGHPVNVFLQENRKIEKIISMLIEPYLNELENQEHFKLVEEGLKQLSDIHVHYQRKENLFFPYMEKYGITAPPKVMWGVDDEIKAQLKLIRTMFSKHPEEKQALKNQVEALLDRIHEMIFKEENIMLPMLIEHMTQDEWKAVYDESPEFGFMVDYVSVWNPEKEEQKTNHPHSCGNSGYIHLPTGEFSIDELTLLFNTLPFDITFVNKDDEVKFFSEGEERIFPRTKSVIGRNVSNCHPPASVHIVEEIVADFKSGKKDNEDFWIQKGDLFILIRYFAVRNEKKEYLGVLEVTQNVKWIRELTGEKRLVSE